MSAPKWQRPATARPVNGPRNERIGRRLTNTDSARRDRLQYLAGHLHALGPRPLFHFPADVERGADLRECLEQYAALPADFIRAYGSDRFQLSVFASTERGNR
jgi:hypothetical protein